MSLSRTHKYFAFFFAMFLAAAVAFGADASAAAPSKGKTPGQWSEAVQKRYAQINSMHAFFNQTITHGESGVAESRRGELFFEKPLLVRWMTKPPAEEILVVNNKAIWQYFPDEELAYKYPLEAMDDKNAFLRVLFGLSSLEKTFEITVLGEEGGLTRLGLLPHEPSLSLLEATLWLEPDSALIKGILITDFYGNRSEVRLDSIETNLALDNKIFAFTPPEGTEVEDHAQQ